MRQFARHDTRLVARWALGLLLLGLGCQTREIAPIALAQGKLLGDPLFNAPGEVQPIDVPTYAYPVGKQSITVRSDSLMRLYPSISRPTNISGYGRLILPDRNRLYDILDNRPQFRWKPTGQKLVAMAIFPASIEVEDDRIVNSFAAVWRWDSSFPTGKDGEIAFNDGRRMKGVDETQQPNYEQDNLPRPLENGVYVWCVWAWDGAGINIRYSSRELPFVVRQ